MSLPGNPTSLTGDAQLLCQYVEERSEAAFTALVQRYVDLVYFAALRRVGGDTHLADDVAQSVFTDLARKAASLKDRPVLTGWLYTSTRFAAAQKVRSERRRRIHEQEAHAMTEIDSAPEIRWEQLRPIIDEVMDELNERDREAVLLRFFENRPLAEIGAKYSLSADAARMRVDRALEKLRELLARRGIASSSTALAGVFVAQSGLAAPAGLVASIVTGTFSQIATTATATLALWKIITAIAIAGFGATAIVHEIRQRHPSVAPPVTTIKAADNVQSPLIPSSSPVIAGAQDRIPINPAVGSVTPRRTGKTTDDFGWPQVGLFAGDETNEKPRHTFAEFHLKMKQDAGFREAVAEGARDHLDLFYGHLFKSLNLPELQLDQLKTFLVEKEQLKIETGEAQEAVGYPVKENRDLFRQEVDQGQLLLDGEIKSLLGDSRYIQYLQYREDLVQWTAVNEMNRRLKSTDTPLTDEQADKLVLLLRTSLLRIHAPFTFDIGFGAGLFPAHIGSALNSRVFRQAGAFLSETQVAALRQMQKSRTAQVK